MKVSFLVLLILSPIVLLAQLDREAIERQRIVANHIAQATQYTHKYTKDKGLCYLCDQVRPEWQPYFDYQLSC